MLECIYCDKEFEHKEIFSSLINKEDLVVISVCMKCMDIHEFEKHAEKEKDGNYWLVMERIYNEYKGHDVNELLNEKPR